MALQWIDWASIFIFFGISLLIGALASRKAGRSSSDFFLSGRNMPWWMLGLSMVATTFSTDTPNLVTDIVRQNGVAGNWVWWAFLLTGMLTVFIYAKLWRRSGVMTDIEFYELRYSGRMAAFLRAFRALYLGVFFNIIIMAMVSLAAIKIGAVMLGLKPYQTILIAAVVTVAYSMMGGLTGVILTDCFQFFIAMFGAVMAAWFALGHPEVGGLANLLAHPNVASKLSILPDFSNTDLLISVLIIPLAVQWWSVWYPGSEPGGGGYLAQRMLSSKNENHAVGATLFFNAAHYALRPWPWIIVALCSLVVYPDWDSLITAFPAITEHKMGHDAAYPAMLVFLPAGLLGIVLASLIAAYMSTISTHLNWGASYVVNDFYRRFVRPEAQERELVWVGRGTILILMTLTCALALSPLLTNAKMAFDLLLTIGAGTGLLFILRWFWWRINAWSELTAMVVSFLVASAFQILGAYTDMMEGVPGWVPLVSGVFITTVAWVLVTFLTPQTKPEKLRSFFRLVRPGGPGWQEVLRRAEQDGDPIEPSERMGANIPQGILCMFLGCVSVYGALFATGCWIYGDWTAAVVLTVIAVAAMIALKKAWTSLNATLL